MRALIFALLLVASPTLAQTSDSRLQTLQTADDGRGWAAVGRLNMNGAGFCTGTLIAPDRVLTAAHCLFDRRTGERLDDSRLEFLAGWRNGRAEASRTVRRAAIWPGFDFALGAAMANVPSDIAVLELDRPIRLPSVTPFDLADEAPPTGAEVTVISYAHDRAEAPSLQETCHVLDQRRDGVTILTCDIDSGASGAPVLEMTPQGLARIVAIISARGETTQRSIALGMRLSGRVLALNAVLDTGVAGVSPGQPQGARVIARFVRPGAP